MKILLGNADPHEIREGAVRTLPGPLVTTVNIVPNWSEEDERWHPGYTPGTDAVEILRHLAQNPGPVKHLGGNEILGEVLSDWDRHSQTAPAWVAVTDSAPYGDAVGEDLERCISEYWGCARGVPADLEDTHYTEYSGVVYSPGEKPEGE